mgnify:CR=1 FL=1
MKPNSPNICKCGCNQPIEPNRIRTARYRLDCYYKLVLKRTLRQTRKRRGTAKEHRYPVGSYQAYHAYIKVYLTS